MQTPIDFGKNFLNSYFSLRDPDKCLEDLAYDVVWITPKQMHHFLTAVEIRNFLQEEMTARPARYYVDIVSIKSSPSAADISTVAYEVNLVSKEEDKAVYLRCSMAICKRGQHFEITFLHMSEKQGQGGMEQIREFTENLPCGVLIFAYMGKEGLKTLFYNEYFWKKLHYKEDQFRKQMERDPFFMVPEEERDKIMDRLKEVRGTGGHLAVNLTFYRKDGNRFQYRMIGAPAYQEGENTVYYCVFQETTGFNQIHARMQERIASASEILAKIPGSLCVLSGEPGDWHPVYVSRQFPEQFGQRVHLASPHYPTAGFHAREDAEKVLQLRIVSYPLHLQQTQIKAAQSQVRLVFVMSLIDKRFQRLLSSFLRATSLTFFFYFLHYFCILNVMIIVCTPRPIRSLMQIYHATVVHVDIRPIVVLDINSHFLLPYSY